MPILAEPDCMGRTRKPKQEAVADSPSIDREKYRKYHKPVRVRGYFVDLAEASAAKLGHDLTQWVNDAIRMRLEAEGAWPPPPPKPGR